MPKQRKREGKKRVSNEKGKARRKEETRKRETI